MLYSVQTEQTPPIHLMKVAIQWEAEILAEQIVTNSVQTEESTFLTGKLILQSFSLSSFKV